MGRNIRISQCMIVKNEEKNIERALSWGRDVVWEQIVVDTGSTDHTVEIAKRMGARLFHFDWIDDFAAAKNYAIEKAGGDWIAFLDADEYLSEEDAKKLPLLLNKRSGREYNALIARWVQTDGAETFLAGPTGKGIQSLRTVKADGSLGSAVAGTVVRIFRNQPGLLYRGRVHEQLFMENGEVRCFDAGDALSVLHTGYGAEEMEEKKKTERNIRLLLAELERHPEEHKLLAHMGASYYRQKKYEEAAEWYEKAASCMPELPEEESARDVSVFRNLMLLYARMNREDLLRKAYASGIRRFPEEADYDYLAGRYYIGEKRFGEAAVHLQRAVGLLEWRGDGRMSALLANGLPEALEMLAVCHYENGDRKSCVNCAVVLLRASPYRGRALEVLLKAFRHDERENREKAASGGQVLAFLGNLYDLEEPEQRRFVLRAAETAGYEALLKEAAP